MSSRKCKDGSLRGVIVVRRCEIYTVRRGNLFNCSSSSPLLAVKVSRDCLEDFHSDFVCAADFAHPFAARPLLRTKCDMMCA